MWLIGGFQDLAQGVESWGAVVVAADQVGGDFALGADGVHG